MSEVVRSAARVLDLLEYFSEMDKEANLAVVSQTFNLPKSSALALLRTLCARGYLDKDELGIYRLNESFRVHGFSWGGGRLTQLLSLARPVMAGMASELEETVTLGVLTTEGTIRLVHQTLAHQPIRYEMSMSLQLPVHCTAMGRMYLAVKNEKERAILLERYPIEPRTKYTVTDPDKLANLINQAKIRDYSVSADEVDIGGTGVCTPVRDSRGNILAMLNVSCVSARFTDKKNHIIQVLLAEGKKLSESIPD